MCRFINADTISTLPCNVNLKNNHLNLYSYCDNNPVVRHDPKGMFWCELWQNIEQNLYLYAYCTGLVFADGPLPIGDVVAILCALGITTYAVYLTVTVDLSVPLSIADTKVDERNKTSDTFGKYYEAFTLGNGSGIAVFMSPSYDIYEAEALIRSGVDIWTPLQEDALTIAIAVSGGFVGPETNGSGNCQHYHLKKRRNGIHIFFGYNGMEAVGRC